MVRGEEEAEEGGWGRVFSGLLYRKLLNSTE